jgi:hypothetical protein
MGLLIAALAIAFALEDPDTWFHLAGGRLIWETGRDPTSDRARTALAEASKGNR